MNSAAIARPDLVGEIADRFGAQCVVLSLDVKRSAATPSGFVVTTHGGRTETALDAVAWAREAVERGAGELLVNSIDADGTKQGFDLELVYDRDVSGLDLLRQKAVHRAGLMRLWVQHPGEVTKWAEAKYWRLRGTHVRPQGMTPPLTELVTSIPVPVLL